MSVFGLFDKIMLGIAIMFLVIAIGMGIYHS
nr:MAG TPA: hypothetical protein [Caudoviricetes sp.]